MRPPTRGAGTPRLEGYDPKGSNQSQNERGLQFATTSGWDESQKRDEPHGPL